MNPLGFLNARTFWIQPCKLRCQSPYTCLELSPSHLQFAGLGCLRSCSLYLAASTAFKPFSFRLGAFNKQLNRCKCIVRMHVLYCNTLLSFREWDAQQNGTCGMQRLPQFMLQPLHFAIGLNHYDRSGFVLTLNSCLGNKRGFCKFFGHSFDYVRGSKLLGSSQEAGKAGTTWKFSCDLHPYVLFRSKCQSMPVSAPQAAQDMVKLRESIRGGLGTGGAMRFKNHGAMA